MWKQPARWLLCVFLFGLGSAGSARADLKTLVMPGSVVGSHARFEQQCERCHEPFRKRGQQQLCLDCHTSLAGDLARHEGFHGRSPGVAAAECQHCHTEHEGRDADIVLLDRETFDHQLTDFKLEGAHRQVACEACHMPPAEKGAEPGAAAPAPAGFFSRALQDCYVCHQTQEPHRQQLGKNCQDCHQAESWHKISYRHAKSGFPLNGMHRSVACGLCHPNQRWRKIAEDCYSCHRLDDAHGGRYGQKCQECHSDKGPPTDPQKPKTAWKRTVFDHGKTRFALDGQHQQLACDLCHSQQLYGQKLKTDCLACHQKDDRHKGFYGPKCTQCHNSKGWRTSVFDHRQTRFPLLEKHQQVACSSCHTRPTAGEKLGDACIGCHQLEDVHRSQETVRCERCHTPAGWRDSARFDHELSRFPLLGLHALTPCESCHQSAEFRRVGIGCNDCHAPDDKHQQRLGTNCQACHTPNGWGLWRFEHDGKESFKLEGAHRELECLACHQNPVEQKIELARTCAACHQKQDIHQGTFGRNCERCHLSESFTKLRTSGGSQQGLN